MAWIKARLRRNLTLRESKPGFRRTAVLEELLVINEAYDRYTDREDERVDELLYTFIG